MKFEEYDLENNEIKKKSSKRKKASGHGGLTAFLTLIIGILSGALLMLITVYYTGPDSRVLRQTDKIINVEKKADSIASEKTDKTAEAEVADAANDDDGVEVSEYETDEAATEDDNAANIDEAKEASALQILKESLMNGDPTSKALRKTFKDELLCARDGKYYFSDKNSSLKMNNYMPENLVEKENGRYEYVFTDGSKAKTGVDVSKYQGEIDWDMVKEDGIDFAIIRAGIRGYESGKLVMDEDFAKNITSAITSGLDVGVYFFSQAVTIEEAEEEADAVIEALDGNGLSYPLVYDLEYIKGGRRSNLSQDEITTITIAFCNRVAEYGYTPMIYGNLDTFLLQLDMSRVEDIQKWMAYYDTDFYFPYDYQLWQYTDSGVVNGIGEEVDLNLDLRQN